MATLASGSTALPEPTEISIDDEIIWSTKTGRSASGKMLGDVTAEKKTIKIKWQFLKEEEYLVIKNALKAGFNPITFRDDGMMLTIQQYRGTLSKTPLGYIGDGKYWYRSISVSLIEQ